MRNAALGLLVVASTACGRIAFDPLSTSGDGQMGDSDGSAQANGCIRVDNLPPVTPYDCATVEQQILSGNIASVSDAALIDWAQHDCMRKPAPAAFAAMAPSAMFPMTTGTGPSCSSGAPPGADGTAPNYTYTGSGTLNLGSVTGTCGNTNLLGT
jgi:hypothetical protein